MVDISGKTTFPGSMISLLPGGLGNIDPPSRYILSWLSSV